MAAIELAKAVVRIGASTARLAPGLSSAHRMVVSTLRSISLGVLSITNQLFRSVFKWVSLITSALGTISAAAMIKIAADTEELRAMFGEVFKAQTKEMIDFSEAMATNIGRSAITIQETMAIFQDTFVPLGFAREEATKMSKAMTVLTEDIAAFKNISSDLAGELLQSGIVGNHRAVRRFGIIITEARLKQELFNMGIENGIKNATAQQKVMARLNIIMHDSKDAMGQALREAGTFTNRLRGLRGAIKDSLAILGAGFLPALAKLAKQLTDVVRSFRPALEQWANEIRLWSLVLIDNWQTVWAIVKKGAAAAFSFVVDMFAAFPQLFAQHIMPALIKAIAKMFIMLGQIAARVFWAAFMQHHPANIMKNVNESIKRLIPGHQGEETIGQFMERNMMDSTKKQFQELGMLLDDLKDKRNELESSEKSKKFWGGLRDRIRGAFSGISKLFGGSGGDGKVKVEVELPSGFLGFAEANRSMQESLLRNMADPQERLVRLSMDQREIQKRMADGIDRIARKGPAQSAISTPVASSSGSYDGGGTTGGGEGRFSSAWRQAKTAFSLGHNLAVWGGSGGLMAGNAAWKDAKELFGSE